jgi:F-type H+-transporting ATPase subunit epsilon
MAEAQAKKTFYFELVSPESVVVSADATMVVIPGGEGDFGVLADHAPILSSVRPGVVTVMTAEGETRKVFVAGGFADVSGKNCSVLAEEALNVSEINLSAVEKDLVDLKLELDAVTNDAVKAAHVQKEIQIAQAKIAATAA